MKATLLLACAVALASMVPLVASTPAACTSDCTIEAHSLGYRPPAMEIRSGASVVFTSIDTVHVHVEQATTQFEPSCFEVLSNTSGDAPPVRFAINGSVLEATTNPGSPDETTATCHHASELDGGGWVLPFVCVLHPALMKGALVVTA